MSRHVSESNLDGIWTRSNIGKGCESQTSPSTSAYSPNALVAQGIEHRFPKPGVGRSNRLGGTNKHAGRPPRRAVYLLSQSGYCPHSVHIGFENVSASDTSASLPQHRVETVCRGLVSAGQRVTVAAQQQRR